MQKRIETAEAEIGTLEAAIAELRPCMSVFADPNAVRVADLPRLLEALRSLIDEEAALTHSDEGRNLFDSAFAGARTSNEKLSAAVTWACAAQDSRKLLLAILSADKVSPARECIGRVLVADGLAGELLSRVCERAKIDTRHFTKDFA
jgi:hypothetical protein